MISTSTANHRNHQMVQQFITFCEQWSLISPGDRVLLAVSGGVDSVVMAHLFSEAGFPMAMAHVNFSLRGEESDRDEAFVRDLASAYAIPLFCERFDTATYAGKEGMSVQMAARELRYRWFEQIRTSEGYDLIATAHHLDDQIETFFINLLRGTGIAGLHGIPPRNGKLIRPLLFASREMIEQYASTKKLHYREDSSNLQQKYTRNKIRHQLIPLLHRIRPDASGNITATIHRIRDSEAILKEQVDTQRRKLFIHENEDIRVSIPQLLELYPLEAWLYELFQPFGCNESTIHDLARSLQGESGKTFLTPEVRIVKDRDTLILTPPTKSVKKIPETTMEIGEDVTEISAPIRLSFTTEPFTTNSAIPASPLMAFLDRDKLDFPLTLRKWEPGDAFYPLGMRQRKKLSDFFIDTKISIPEKEKTWVLCSGSRILWVIGHRIDHRFRVTGHTKTVLVVAYIP